MALATYRAPYALRQIVNQDPSVMATPQPKAEELAYAVAGEQAGIEAEAAQREEDIALKKLALAQKADQAKESIQLKREALEDYKSGSTQALAFSTVGAGINTLRGYMQAEKIEGITAKVLAYQDKMSETYSQIIKQLGITGKTYGKGIETEIAANNPALAASKTENRESESLKHYWRNRR